MKKFITAVFVLAAAGAVYALDMGEIVYNPIPSGNYNIINVTNNLNVNNTTTPVNIRRIQANRSLAINGGNLGIAVGQITLTNLKSNAGGKVTVTGDGAGGAGTIQIPENATVGLGAGKTRELKATTVNACLLKVNKLRMKVKGENRYVDFPTEAPTKTVNGLPQTPKYRWRNISGWEGDAATGTKKDFKILVADFESNAAALPECSSLVKATTFCCINPKDPDCQKAIRGKHPQQEGSTEKTTFQGTFGAAVAGADDVKCDTINI